MKVLVDLIFIRSMVNVNYILNVSTGFTITPSPVVVEAGAEAVFRCQHSTARFIDWRVNGSTVGQSPPPDMTPSTTRDENDALVNTLTILAHPEYNKTEVECEAFFSNGSPSEVTPPVTLTIIRG